MAPRTHLQRGRRLQRTTRPHASVLSGLANLDHHPGTQLLFWYLTLPMGSGNSLAVAGRMGPAFIQFLLICHPAPACRTDGVTRFRNDHTILSSDTETFQCRQRRPISMISSLIHEPTYRQDVRCRASLQFDEVCPADESCRALRLHLRNEACPVFADSNRQTTPALPPNRKWHKPQCFDPRRSKLRMA